MPGWSRAHLLSHLARNAEALQRLVSWAATGVETPMYPSREHRAADIDAGATRVASEIIDDQRQAGAALIEALAGMSPEAQSATVRTALGRPIPGAEIPFMRVRELWVHVGDLDVGLTMRDLPDDIAVALVHDICASMRSRIDMPIRVDATGCPAEVLGPAGQHVAVVTGPPASIAGWLAGRLAVDAVHVEGVLPPMPPWL